MTALQVSKPLVSFLGDPAVKEKYLNRVRTHRAADEIIHGTYWTGNGEGKGCAVGCTLHDPSGNHRAYETELGIPVQLAWIQDGLFERLSAPDDVMFPEQFLEAIPKHIENRRLSLMAERDSRRTLLNQMPEVSR